MTETSGSVISVEGVGKLFRIRTQRQRLSLFGGIGDMLAPRRKFWALRDLDLDVRKGEMLGVIGMNGSGKSTLLKLIAGISFPTTGKISIHGKVGSLIELGAGFHPELSGYENVYLNGSVLGLERSAIDEKMPAIVEFAELEEFMDTPVKHYSSGMFVRLGFAIAIQLQPDILLLDETMAVGDMGFQARAYRAIGRFRETGATTLMVSHDIYVLREYSDRMLWLHEGQVRMLGDPYDVSAAYMDLMSERSGVHALGFFAHHGDRLYLEPPVDNPPVEIARIDVTDGEGAPIESVTRPPIVRISIGYRCNRPVDRMRVCLALVVEKENAVVLEKDSEREGVPFGPLEPGEGSVQFTFDASRINRQRFQAIVAFYDPNDASRVWSRGTAGFFLDGRDQPISEKLDYIESPCDHLEHLPLKETQHGSVA
ncbi:ATP-binding cassette domain-containing protein [bacterium]|nr:ATP-binding cassette domain-containing protein [bacterium]